MDASSVIGLVHPDDAHSTGPLWVTVIRSSDQGPSGASAQAYIELDPNNFEIRTNPPIVGGTGFLPGYTAVEAEWYNTQPGSGHLDAYNLPAYDDATGIGARFIFTDFLPSGDWRYAALGTQLRAGTAGNAEALLQTDLEDASNGSAQMYASAISESTDYQGIANLYSQFTPGDIRAALDLIAQSAPDLNYEEISLGAAAANEVAFLYVTSHGTGDLLTVASTNTGTYWGVFGAGNLKWTGGRSTLTDANDMLYHYGLMV